MNALLIFTNKKTEWDYKWESALVRAFSDECVYFDDVARVAFDNPEAMTSRLFSCVNLYDDCVILCHKSQLAAVGDYVLKLTGGIADEDGAISFGGKSVILCDIRQSTDYIRDLTLKTMQKKGEKHYYKAYIKCVGAPRESVEKCLRLAKDCGGDISCAVSESYDDTKIEVVYGKEASKTAVDGAVRVFATELQDYIYALGNVTLAEQLIRLLKLRRMKISCAESFTGGGVGKKIVSISGASEVFFESLNTYDNSSKILRLGVNELTIKRYGAVSSQTAREMAEGLLSSGTCDVAISTTGIAGPKSDNTNKPVGLAYIGIGVKDEGVTVYEFNFKGDRETVTATAINRALFLAYKRLK